MILVTGATGMLGSHVLYELASSGKPVRAFYRDPSKIDRVRKVFGYYAKVQPKAFDSIEWVKADINDYYSVCSAFEGISQVYHTAGIVTFNDKEKKKLDKVNTHGTANIVNACLEREGIKLCHVSSIATLGELATGLPVTEDVIWNRGHAASAYAISKLKGEMEVWRGINEGLNAVIVNPSVIIGPGMWVGPGMELFNKVIKGLNFYPPGSSGYIDVRDVSHIMIMLMDSRINGERFILNSGNISHKEFLTMLANNLKSRLPDKLITPSLWKTAVFLEAIRSVITRKTPRINRHTFSIAATDLNYSNNKVIERLGIKFISIEESLRDAVNIFKAQF